jgi:phospholipid N-methyltransferase
LDLSEKVLFLRAFLAHPRRVGAVLPTSDRAVADMLDMAAFERAELVVELGAGTGSHTTAVLARLGPQADLVAFEIDPVLADALRTSLPDPRLQVVTARRKPSRRCWTDGVRTSSSRRCPSHRCPPGPAG